MSMTVYPVTGESLSLNATDNKNATGLLEANSGGLPMSAYGGIVTVSQDREVTKAGATRVMVKVAYKAPMRDPAAVGVSEAMAMGEVTAHCVLTVPKRVAETLVFESTGQLDPYVGGGVAWVIAALAALTNNKSLASLPAVTADHPLIRGVTGALPLNVESGTYGSAS